ncbi:MAG: AMP-binding protein [Bacteroidales bacterium]|nr:AMP-binding protein [Candidatus Physcousia equi]
MTYHIERRILHFHQPAGTSRGWYTTRTIWLVTLCHGSWQGVGECAPLPDLSCDALPVEDYERRLHTACRMTCQLAERLPEGCVPTADNCIPYSYLLDAPSILFALEGAMQSPLSPTFAESSITINGLIWMGSIDEMRCRIDQKLSDGFHCIKLKIGAINFDDELALLAYIRERHDASEVELRVDANGGLSPLPITHPGYLEDVRSRLRLLASFNLHSIEQPIPKGHAPMMATLCQEATLPIALDEELIGIHRKEDKVRMLDTIRPHYLVLKPSLHGGLAGCDEWIRLAEERGMGWWATSALESNVGLGTIARWLMPKQPPLPQGLGTGLLFTDNTPPTTQLHGEVLKNDERTIFLAHWNDSHPQLLLNTSGSTGAPKPIWVEKERMRASARTTCDFLHLQQGDTALLCMPLQYIAGMMMVVRAMERKLRLVCVQPSNRPFRSLLQHACDMVDFCHNPNGTVTLPAQTELLGSLDFVAMVPSQVYETLRHPDEANLLRQVRHLLIGGGSIPPDLEAELRTFPNPVWSSYGMTETLSHIALRRLNGACEELRSKDGQQLRDFVMNAEDCRCYYPLPGVTLSKGADSCLVIDAPHLCQHPLVTHDIVEMNPDGGFRILGRSDNVVCSGGIKIQMEEVESCLRHLFGDCLMVTSRPHPKFGEALVYLTTLPPALVRAQMQGLPSFPPHWLPKDIILVDALPLTATGKPDRAKAKAMVR